MTFSAPAQKLAAYAPLTATEVGIVGALAEGRLQSHSKGCDIVSQGQSLTSMFMIIDGWAMRYKTLVDGRRQILSFLVSGDVCDPYCFLLHQADHSIGTITEVTAVTVNRSVMEDIVLGHPGLAKAMWVNALVTASIQREWCVSIGQRSAFERLSHLFCEMYSRLEVVGLAKAGRCAFPVNQYDLADATGMTAVHVNRVLQEMRNNGLIELQRPDLFIPDLPRLQAVALFDPLYLHPKPREPDAREAMYEQ